MQGTHLKLFVMLIAHGTFSPSGFLLFMRTHRGHSTAVSGHQISNTSLKVSEGSEDIRVR